MRKNTLRISLVAVAIAGAFLAFGSLKSAPKATTPCKESLDECCQQKSKKGENMVWESLSGQFFSSSDLN